MHTCVSNGNSCKSNGQENLKISQGVISGFQAHLLQTDTPINSGNSGGPLVILNEKTNE